MELKTLVTQRILAGAVCFRSIFRDISIDDFRAMNKEERESVSFVLKLELNSKTQHDSIKVLIPFYPERDTVRKWVRINDTDNESAIFSCREESVENGKIFLRVGIDGDIYNRNIFSEIAAEYSKLIADSNHNFNIKFDSLEFDQHGITCKNEDLVQGIEYTFFRSIDGTTRETLIENFTKLDSEVNSLFDACV